MFECTKGSYQVCANIEEEKKEFETTCKCGNSITSTTAKEITPTLETIVVGKSKEAAYFLTYFVIIVHSIR